MGEGVPFPKVIKSQTHKQYIANPLVKKIVPKKLNLRIVSPVISSGNITATEPGTTNVKTKLLINKITNF